MPLNPAQVSEADVKAMFGDEAQLESTEGGPDDSAEVSQLLAAPEGSAQEDTIDIEAMVGQVGCACKGCWLVFEGALVGVAAGCWCGHVEVAE